MKLLEEKLDTMEDNTLIYIDYTEFYMNKNIEANLIYFNLLKCNIDFIPVEDNINDFLLLKTTNPELMEIIPFFIVKEDKKPYILQPIQLMGDNNE